MRLAGISVGHLAVEELAVRLQVSGDRALATELRRAVAQDEIAIALSRGARLRILDALRDCPAGLLRFRDELRSQSGQTMSEYAVVLGGIALAVVVAIVFLGGRVADLFGGTGSSVQPRPAPFVPPRPSAVPFPSATRDCENGGWRNYAQFANEADCRAYVDEVSP